MEEDVGTENSQSGLEICLNSRSLVQVVGTVVVVEIEVEVVVEVVFPRNLRWSGTKLVWF